MRIAILDLGTNTFNLLVAEIIGNHKFQILHNQKMPVKLGEGRINQGEIIPSAYLRGKETILQLQEIANSYEVSKIKAFGTSALRTAANGNQFIEEIKKTCGIEIELITGDREAELIYLGVKQTIEFDHEKLLILDIGGGSNELIIADKERIYWKKSYPLGIARLLERFKPSDPITTEELNKIQKYLIAEMKELIQVAKEFSIKILVGASGSFETFVAMINQDDVLNTEESLEASSFPITISEFEELYLKLINSKVSERKSMIGLEPMRIEMIPLASLFVKSLLESLNIKKIKQSNFALKEGVIAEIMNKNV